MAKEEVIRAVSAQNVRAHVEAIVTGIPHRAAGSENGRRMAEYSRDAMKAVGLGDAQVHELPALVSFPEHAELRVEGPRQISIQANALGHSVETFADGISGELVYVGSESYADFEAVWNRWIRGPEPPCRSARSSRRGAIRRPRPTRRRWRRSRASASRASPVFSSSPCASRVRSRCGSAPT